MHNNTLSDQVTQSKVAKDEGGIQINNAQRHNINKRQANDH